ncbi:MAG: hypothetical protein EP336_09390 [Rhodobacteraceae bacterium]|nr:MAG: hypothetical protein EP336_09390 [Paracoccaceae bacterium]
MGNYREISVEGFEAVEPKPQPAPQIMLVKIANLVIDEMYQRPLARNNITAIKRIASDFQWARFSPIIVAPVAGGRYAVIDGQHRTYAAAICGFDSVPAMVTLIAPADQALAFIEINTSQIRVSSHSVYRAALAAEDEWAVRARNAVEAAGCRLMTCNMSTNRKKPGMVFAVTLIKGLVDKGHDAAITSGLKAMVDFEHNVPNFSNALLTPWLNAVAKSGTSDTDVLGKVLHTRRPWLVIDNAAKFAKEHGRSAAQTKRDAFVTLINHVMKAGE